MSSVDQSPTGKLISNSTSDLGSVSTDHMELGSLPSTPIKPAVENGS